MKAGKLRHYVYVLQPVDDFTVKGDDTITYTAPQDGVNDDYASIEPVVGRELLVARQIRADIGVKITLRYRPDITHRTRIQWSDGAIEHTYELGPEVNAENRNIELAYYGIEIK